MFELNDQVKVVLEGDALFGRTGKVSSILSNAKEKNIGVDIDWDGGDPKAYYFNENELELVKDMSKEEGY